MPAESPDTSVSSRLTTADRFDALKESLAWYLPLLLARSVEGKVARGAAVDFLTKQIDEDKDRGVDLVARGMLVSQFKRFDGLPVSSNPEPEQTAAFGEVPRNEDSAGSADPSANPPTARRVNMTPANTLRLLRCLSPQEVAQLIDESTPPIELERLGSAVEALGEREADHATQSGSHEESYERLFSYLGKGTR